MKDGKPVLRETISQDKMSLAPGATAEVPFRWTEGENAYEVFRGESSSSVQSAAAETRD